MEFLNRLRVDVANMKRNDSRDVVKLRALISEHFKKYDENGNIMTMRENMPVALEFLRIVRPLFDLRKKHDRNMFAGLCVRCDAFCTDDDYFGAMKW